MRRSHQSTAELAQHGEIIEALARETGTATARVQELYEREFADLEATATVKAFLCLLASRHVRAVLRGRHHS